MYEKTVLESYSNTVFIVECDSKGTFRFAFLSRRLVSSEHFDLRIIHIKRIKNKITTPNPPTNPAIQCFISLYCLSIFKYMINNPILQLFIYPIYWSRENLQFSPIRVLQAFLRIWI